MILGGLEIKKRLNKDIFIEPYDEKLLNTNSYNLRLHNELLYYTNNQLDMRQENKVERLIMPDDGFEMEAGKLYLGRTIEYTKTTECVPMLEGRSSIGRLGLFIHVTAGFGDVGFAGYWTLEMFCVQPIKVYPGVPIAQIFYHTVEGDFIPYASKKYQNNTGVQPSLLYKDFEKEKQEAISSNQE